MTAAVTVAQSGAPGVSLGFKNRIINGGMTIDQRNGGGSSSFDSTLRYGLDRWQSYSTTGSGSTLQQVSDAPIGFTNSLKITVGTGASPSSSQQNILWQPIEGYNVADLGLGASGAQTVTFSFWVKASVTGTFNVWFQNSGSGRSYVTTYTVNAAGTWEQKSVTISGDTSGTWLKTNGVGLVAGFSLGCASGFNATVNTWSSGDYKSTSGVTNIVATSGATFQVTGVQLEVGTAATQFEFRDYGRELIMCQRYYEKTSFPYRGSAFNAGGQGFCMWLFKTTKRAAPTITYVNSVYTSVDFVQVDGVLIATNDTNYPTIGTGSSATAEL